MSNGKDCSNIWLRKSFMKIVIYVSYFKQLMYIFILDCKFRLIIDYMYRLFQIVSTD